MTTTADGTEPTWRALAATYQDNAGITRIKVLPAAKIASAGTKGFTASLSAGALFSTDDYPVSTPALDSAIGDLRGFPDMSAAVLIDREKGLAWAPSDLSSMDGSPFPGCQRSALRRLVGEAREAGFELLVGMELEFTVFRGSKAEPIFAHTGPGYGALPFLELENYHLALLDAFEVAGLPVEQLHPEYINGQLEVSLAPREPVQAVDEYLLARFIITRVAAAHGLLVSFGPIPVAGFGANGLHIHLSARDAQGNVFYSPDTADGIRAEGGQMIAGVLDVLGEGIALLGGTRMSFARLQPHNWAGAYICWGDGNREAAIRLMRGFAGSEDTQANIEVKCADGSSNQYLAVTTVIAGALHGLRRSLPVPADITVEPGSLPEEERSRLGVAPFASDLGEALDALEGSTVLREALGDILFDTYLAVRRHEWDTMKDLPIEEAAAISRFRY